MRLTPHELHSIRSLLRKTDAQGQAWLFGSRADDNRKGGDIDLYFEPQRVLDLKTRLQLQYQLSSECATKVDLLVKNPGQANSDIFDIARQGIPL